MDDGHPDRAEHMLEVALMLGERDGWDAVRLHGLARHMGVALTEIHLHDRQKDDLAEAWLDRADLALIRAGQPADWEGLSVRERPQRTMLAWFEALAAQREPSIRMLRYQL